MNETTRDPRPWYRQIWPWLLMLPPALSVAGGVTMVYLATHTPAALVVDDYARIEELTNERFERDREAQRLGLTAELRIEREAGRIELALAASAPYELPGAVHLLCRADERGPDLAARRRSALARRPDRAQAAGRRVRSER
jgi:hypothetical protein